MATALILGASGQDGPYLAQHCRDAGMRVIGVSRNSGDVRADVADFPAIKSLVEQYQPAMIFHLAATSTTSHAAGPANHAAISMGSLNVLEAVHQSCRDAKVFITGSGLQFENQGLPIHECDPFVANSIYAVARIQSVYAARYYRSLGVKAYVGYLFHHESPDRKPQHVSRMIADAASRIAAGGIGPVEVGDLSVRKEWTFAGDIARAMVCLLQQDQIFEAVLGSGADYSIQDWAAECFGIVGLNWRDHVREKSGFTSEYKMLLSDPATIRSLGWSPQVEFRDLARMMMNAAASRRV